MSEEIEYANPEPGEWVLPVMNGYRWKCCDCQLVHSIDFEAGRMQPDGSFIPDHTLRVMFAVTRDDEETAKAREGEETDITLAPTVKKPRQTPHKDTKGTKPAPEGTGTRQRAGKAPQGAQEP